MWCCVSRAVAGADRGPPYDQSSSKVQPAVDKSETLLEVEQCSDPDVASILLPCAFCARTFMPQSLEKHARICEQAATKKRKLFDSAKQRIQGTELAEFQPRQERRRHCQDDRTSASTWKQTHDDFLRAIRAARNEIAEPTMQKHCNSMATSSAPTRANEQGMCPTCNRHFGVKAFDRHVAWCKERVAKAPISPATNIAKERLEARMRYRAPSLKNSRQTTREKYSPGSAITLNASNKGSPSLPTNRAKESASAPNCNKTNDSPVKHKSAVVRRSGQTKESGPLGPMKSRQIDRTNRPPEDEAGPPLFRPAPPTKRTSHLPVPPLKHKKEGLEECSSTPRASKRHPRKREDRARREEPASSRVKQEDKHQALHSARSQKASIVSARSQGNPKVNDVSINAEVNGMTVKPCHIYRGNELTTWKRISQEKGQQRRDVKAQNLKNLPNTPFPDHGDRGLEEFVLNERLLEDDAEEAAPSECAFKDDIGKLSSRSGSVNWSTVTANLNRTYSFKDSVYGDLDDAQLTGQRKWRPVKHSPRIEFRLGDQERVDKLHSSSYGCTRLAELDGSSGAGSGRANQTNRSRNPGIEDESKPADSKPGYLDLETSKQELPSEHFQSTRSKLLERKRLTSAGYAEVSPESNYEVTQECSDSSPITDSQENRGVNSIIAGLNNRVSVTEDAKSDGENSTSKANLREEDTEALTGFSEKFDKCNTIFNDETLEQEADQSTLYKESNETVYIEAFKNESDAEFLQDELDLSAKNEVAPVERNLGTEIDAFLTNDTLEPTGSSTPFNAQIENPLSKCDTYDSLRENSPPPPENCDWKMSVDAEKGAEMLYRVETRGSSASSSSVHAKLDKSNQTSYEEFENSSSTRASKLNASRIVSSVSPAAIRKEEEVTVQGVRDNPCQVNLCNSSSNASLDFKCEKVDNESDDEMWDFDCDDSSKDKSTKKGGKAVEGSSNSQADADFPQNSADSKPDVAPRKPRKPNFKGKLTKDKLRKSSKSRIIVQSIVDRDEAVKEEVLEIYRNCASNDFDYDSDNTVGEQIIGGKMNRGPTSVKDDTIGVRNLRSIILSESRVELKKLTSRSTAVKRRCSRVIRTEDEIRGGMNILNESTDSLASSLDTMDVADVQQVESVEVETIEEIGTRNRSIRFRVLPEIKKAAKVVVNEKYGEEKLNTQTYWEKAEKASRNRLINLDPPSQGASRFLKRNPKVCVLPPVPSNSSLIRYRSFKLPLRPVWSNYVRRRPDFNLVLSGRTGKDYDPFLLAEQQMNDLLSDTSEQSVTESPPRAEQSRDTSFPLSHSSAFVKYPYSVPEKRSSLIAPPFEFDDLTTDFSSDSTETNSLSREVFLKGGKEFKESISRPDAEKKSPARELGRRVIIDKSRALGGDVVDDAGRGTRSFVGSTERARKILDKVSPKVVQPAVNRSLSVRASSAPKAVTSNDSRDKKPSRKNESQRSPCSLRNRSNNYANLSNSNLSLSSIVSSDVDIKRSNSVFDELMTSFEDGNASFPSLKSLLKHDSLSTSSPAQSRQRNNQVSDEELSSPESYKRQDRGKLSADSAYSSLNRKYSNHGRSANDVAGRLEEDMPRKNRRDGDATRATAKCKMSKFCHECGSKFPETAKFCCECGIRRLVL
ncbi:uncharacterized protein LOC143372428 [Andrena cerasifolii]|uniref:uncharacterized protein LOC143372428 n=1 Tax=Andrena cerasifolii TaxID=2819439 RepID=UPI00403817B2